MRPQPRHNVMASVALLASRWRAGRPLSLNGVVSSKVKTQTTTLPWRRSIEIRRIGLDGRCCFSTLNSETASLNSFPPNPRYDLSNDQCSAQRLTVPPRASTLQQLRNPRARWGSSETWTQVRSSSTQPAKKDEKGGLSRSVYDDFASQPHHVSGVSMSEFQELGSRLILPEDQKGIFFVFRTWPSQRRRVAECVQTKPSPFPCRSHTDR